MRIALICPLAMALLACGHPEPAAPPPKPRVDATAAITALQAGRFEDATREAAAVLARDPHSSKAAAVRAVATYQQAGEHLVNELAAVLDQGENLKFFDHERGRQAWRTFLDQLAAVDADLAVVADDPDFSLELCLACWEHDWNRNGQIDERDRHVFEIEVDDRGEDLPEGDPRRRPTFRFDRGDADWARAMISFQRAAAELALAYRWSELDKLFIHYGEDSPIVIHLVDPDRVRHARALVLAGVGFADRCRAEYLAETDDDREWVPNPRQHSHPVPLPVDDALYARWAAITGDVRRLLAGEEGISLREVGAALDPELGRAMPDAYIDVGRLLSDPTDITLDFRKGTDEPAQLELAMRGLFGHGYTQRMRASPLVARLRHMQDELERGEDSYRRKLRYLFWLN
jgi:hypothetical protein